MLVGTENERPYERPPLSKAYLRGEVGREKVYVHDERFYAEHDIDLRLGRTAVSLDTSGREVVLDDGERLRYDRVLLSTGAEPRRLSIPGGSSTAFSICAASRTRTACANGWTVVAAVVVVGAGWIGAEVAASARQRGSRSPCWTPSRSRSSGCSGPEWAPSTATSIPTTARRC